MDDMCMTGRTGTQAAAMFIGMWAVMMIPMMLPSLVPALRQLRTASAAAIAGLAYFVVWTAVGLAVYPVDTALSGIAMRAPIVAGMAIVLAGMLQFTAWKARRLACGQALQSSANPLAWRHGLRLGVDCVASCGNLMAVLIVVGMMNLVAMALVTVAITVERRMPASARIIGAVVVAAGALMIVQAL